MTEQNIVKCSSYSTTRRDANSKSTTQGAVRDVFQITITLTLHRSTISVSNLKQLFELYPTLEQLLQSTSTCLAV